jgi:hypothetical protein
MRRSWWSWPLLLLCAAVARADVIVGLQLGRQSLDMREIVNGTTRSGTLTTDPALGLVAGMGQPGGGDRVFVGYESYTLGNQDELGIFSVGYHGLLPALASGPGLALRPFLGAEAGYGRLDLAAGPGLGAASDSHFTYGARAGLNLALSAHAEIEAGVRYSVIDLAAPRQGTAGSDRLEIETNRGWWLGFNLGL